MLTGHMWIRIPHWIRGDGFGGTNFDRRLRPSGYLSGNGRITVTDRIEIRRAHKRNKAMKWNWNLIFKEPIYCLRLWWRYR